MGSEEREWNTTAGLGCEGVVARINWHVLWCCGTAGAAAGKSSTRPAPAVLGAASDVLALVVEVPSDSRTTKNSPKGLVLLWNAIKTPRHAAGPGRGGLRAGETPPRAWRGRGRKGWVWR